MAMIPMLISNSDLQLEITKHQLSTGQFDAMPKQVGRWNRSSPILLHDWYMATWPPCASEMSWGCDCTITPLLNQSDIGRYTYMWVDYRPCPVVKK